MTLSDMELGAVRRRGAVYDLLFERRFAKPIERVWAALTVPERIADWFLDADVDLRTGGRMVLSAPGYASSEHTIVELDPPRVLAWTWPHAEHPDSVVRFELEPDGKGCRLRLTQTNLPAPRLISIATGWHVHMEGLPAAADSIRHPFSRRREREMSAVYRARLPAWGVPAAG
ncbi:MAG TPA: SRPBCC family protein [Phenylobacterium sp.]|uniref:SRPBCC family protein n=1 Tax=Phenylobacterium sp. TaxID=1871053 RepID=UPI002BC11087|nr:SRPBCC family protein [Phenylobacterium sp.]HSV02599.1 SRPBCC family protein [Phenylobacterium sp.]